MSGSVVVARLDAARPRAWYSDEVLDAALTATAEAAGWASGPVTPFGNIIPAGATVVVKPNWVLHENKGPWGLEPLVTHPTMVRLVVAMLLRSGAAHVSVGDAPLQSCDFAQLMGATGLATWAAELAARDRRFGGIHDFRRTRSSIRHGVLVQQEDQVGRDEFVLFDLGADSVLDPVAGGADDFRVTQYHPKLMRETHRQGRHQYLVAKQVIEADVVVNLPKLKTHKKAGITSALKNIVGINGNKEFLPHHRVGGSASGGDCYPGRSALKRTVELLLDAQNSTDHQALKRAMNLPIRALGFVANRTVDRLGVEGAWSGNDTVWRMCLDLNRILLYGRADGSLADVPQRRVLNIVDGAIAGQGDGPLAPQPFPLGVLLAGEDAPSVDWIGARLLGYEPKRLPIVREAFGRFRWPLTGAQPDTIRVVAPGGVADDLGTLPVPHVYPLGWLDAVDRARHREAPRGTVLASEHAAAQPLDA